MPGRNAQIDRGVAHRPRIPASLPRPSRARRARRARRSRPSTTFPRCETPRPLLARSFSADHLALATGVQPASTGPGDSVVDSGPCSCPRKGKSSAQDEHLLLPEAKSAHARRRRPARCCGPNLSIISLTWRQPKAPSGPVRLLHRSSSRELAGAGALSERDVDARRHRTECGRP